MALLDKLLSPAKKVAGQIFTDGILAETKEVEKRLRICNLCSYYFKKTKTYLKCGCFVDIKSKFLNQRCVLNKW